MFLFLVHWLYENELLVEKNDGFVAAQRKETRNHMLSEWDLNTYVMNMDTMSDFVPQNVGTCNILIQII